MIVYTRGRVPNSDQDYRATDAPGYMGMPMITLVNRNSASASEIVSGALQDTTARSSSARRRSARRWCSRSIASAGRRPGADDRALLHAERTPHQRPWDGTFDEYLTYTMKDQETRALRGSAEVHHRRPQGLQRRRHRARRAVRRPARRVQRRPASAGRCINARQLFATYAEQFYARGPTPGRGQGTPQVREEGVRGRCRDGRGLQGLRRRTQHQDGRRGLGEGLEFIKAMIRFEIDQAVFDIATARQRLITADPQARFALSAVPRSRTPRRTLAEPPGRVGQ
jgi:hypothetical protein